MSPDVRQASTIPEAEQVAEELGYPVKISPSDGRLPLFVATRRDQVANAMRHCMVITIPVNLEHYVRSW